uniref:Uncharacterized protein n=1 Tax=Pseudictyota dubia TaxID=2749911 RepID=A0A7R9WBS9_9STRA|mmetsp:Transcript_43285/g.80428  ORF Transcript_43285/g.80428 Transcript_43285/m.80428 type:complete len:461 (+) Transcript_43285:125-1507(+)
MSGAASRASVRVFAGDEDDQSKKRLDQDALHPAPRRSGRERRPNPKFNIYEVTPPSRIQPKSRQVPAESTAAEEPTPTAEEPAPTAEEPSLTAEEPTAEEPTLLSTPPRESTDYELPAPPSKPPAPGEDVCTSRGPMRPRNPIGNYWCTDFINSTFPMRIGCGDLLPRANWRYTAQLVREWRKLGGPDQRREREKYDALPLETRQEYERKVPGEKKRYPRASRASSASRTNAPTQPTRRGNRSDAEVVHTSMTDDAERRQEKVDESVEARKRAPKRSRLSRPQVSSQLHDAVAIAGEDRALRSIGELIFKTCVVDSLEIDDNLEYNVTAIVTTNVKPSAKLGGKRKEIEGKRKTVIVSSTVDRAMKGLTEASKVFKVSPPVDNEFHIMLDGDDVGQAMLERRGVPNLTIYNGDSIVDSVKSYTDARKEERKRPYNRGARTNEATNNELADGAVRRISDTP